MTKYKKVIVLGGGIVGLSTAWTLLRRCPQLQVQVIDKEPTVAKHQSSRNSGVLHSGIYYKPGSLKAINCRRGLQLMIEFCREQGVAFEQCGKVIVAVDQGEMDQLERLSRRGEQNGVTCRRIGPEELREIEPHCAGLAALHVLESGIADYPAVCRRLSELILDLGGQLSLGKEVVKVASDGDGVRLETAEGEEFLSDSMINCTGLFSDKVALSSGHFSDVRIVPFRGEFYQVTGESARLFNHLIYPVPNPKYPFLGVHFSRKIDGRKKAGPNAVLAFAREGYLRSDFDFREMASLITDKRFVRFASEHWRVGLEEVVRSYSKTAFVNACRRLLPDIDESDLELASSGVRAQAMGSDGTLLDDFRIEWGDRCLHVLNSPSPAATASLSIAEMICDEWIDKTGVCERSSSES